MRRFLHSFFTFMSWFASIITIVAVAFAFYFVVMLALICLGAITSGVIYLAGLIVIVLGMVSIERRVWVLAFEWGSRVKSTVQDFFHSVFDLQYA